MVCESYGNSTNSTLYTVLDTATQIYKETLMNASDKKEFELIHTKIDTISNNINAMKTEAEAQHEMLRQDVKFVKENLFNPHQGLWAETKLNTQFRDNTTRWRFPIGVGFISLAIKHIWDMVKPT